MWDRLLVDCNIATFEEAPGNPLGIIENGAIGDCRRQDPSRRQAHRARGVPRKGGGRARRRLGHARPDRLSHPPRFGGTRADEHAMRRAGASYEDIAKAGGGLPRPSSEPPPRPTSRLLEQSRRRLHALMRGGCTTIEIKSGYGLDRRASSGC